MSSGGRTPSSAGRGRGRGAPVSRRVSLSSVEASSERGSSAPRPAPQARRVSTSSSPLLTTGKKSPEDATTGGEKSSTLRRAPGRPSIASTSVPPRRRAPLSSAVADASASISSAKVGKSPASSPSPHPTATSSSPRSSSLVSPRSSSSSSPPSSSPSSSTVAAVLQVKALAARLFPSERESEVDGLIVARLPRDSNAEAAALVRSLQDALDDSVRQRRRFVESASEVERQLVLSKAEMGQVERQWQAEVEELTTTVTSLKLDKTNAVTAVEARWRTKVDEEVERSRKELEQMRKRMEGKEEEAAQLMYVNMANERRIAELTTFVSTAAATQMVDQGDERRTSDELKAVRQEKDSLVKQLEAKGTEVSTAMETFSAMQRMTVEREGELKAKAMAAEAKVEDLSASLEVEKEQSAGFKEELMESLQDVKSLKDKLKQHTRQSSLEGADGGAGGVGIGDYSAVAELRSRLAVESSLKERAEQREQAERQERVATHAQLLAVEQSKLSMVEENRVAAEKREKKIVAERDEFCDRAEALALSVKEYKDTAERLEAEKRMLQRTVERIRGQGNGAMTTPSSAEKRRQRRSGNKSSLVGGDDEEDDDDESTRSGGDGFGGDWSQDGSGIEKELRSMGRGGGGGGGQEQEKVGLWGRLRGKGKTNQHGGGSLPSPPPSQQQQRRRPPPSQGAQQKNAALAAADTYGEEDDEEGNESAGGQSATTDSSARTNDFARESEEGGGSSPSGVEGGAAAEEASNLKLKSVEASLLQATEEAERCRLDCEEAQRNSAEQADELVELAGLNETLKCRVKELELENARLVALVAATKDECKATLAELEEKVREGETKRRKMHNLIQELRGNVRVFARVRPFLPNDKNKNQTQPWLQVQADGVSLHVLSTTPGQGKGLEASHSFGFDKSFDPSSGQEDVFLEVSEFVQSALDGYNVCLFSYGQTGSGKTHTMQGLGTGGMRGIIPRAVAQVATYKSQLEEQGWSYTMKVSFVEIYCEKIRDLLRGETSLSLSSSALGSSSSSSSSAASGSSAQARSKEHKIVRNDFGANEIVGVAMVEVDPSDEDTMARLMEVAGKARATTRTDMNDTSSRSHSVFTLHLTATNKRLNNAHIHGQLNLCDLAGSERVDRSGVTGTALVEAKNINKSLSALAHVFESLSKNQAHVPFRDSTLTYLLEPALSGNGKTLMIVNLSPTMESVPESLSTLRFGAKVNKIELGKPKRQIGQGGASSSSSSGSGGGGKDRYK